jgi:hypothetical protein
MSEPLKMESITVTIELQPNQVAFAKTLLDDLPGTWELHRARLMASCAISWLNYLMIQKLASEDPAALDGSGLRPPAETPAPGDKGTGLRPGEFQVTASESR